MNLRQVGSIDAAAVFLNRDVEGYEELYDLGLTETILERNKFDGKIPLYFCPDTNSVILGVPRTAEVFVQ